MLAIKSTMDKKIKELADSLSVEYLDLDDTTRTVEVLGTKDSALILEYGTFCEDPRDPLYRGNVHIGARTADDPANYEILALVGKVSALFPQGERILLHDESEVSQGPLVGILTPGESEALPQTYDLLSGFRLVNVPFKAQRLLI